MEDIPDFFVLEAGAKLSEKRDEDECRCSITFEYWSRMITN